MWPFSEKATCVYKRVGSCQYVRTRYDCKNEHSHIENLTVFPYIENLDQTSNSTQSIGLNDCADPIIRVVGGGVAIQKNAQNPDPSSQTGSDL